jgi:ribosome-associated heat shock protein Hsp15
MSDNQLEKGLRLDKWLWHARFMKSRSLSTRFCQLGKVGINGNIVSKSHYVVRLFDVLTFQKGNDVRIIKILKLGDRRGSAPDAQLLYEDLSPPSHVKKDSEPDNNMGKRDLGSGRPTKTERRAIDSLMAKDDQWKSEQ